MSIESDGRGFPRDEPRRDVATRTLPARVSEVPLPDAASKEVNAERGAKHGSIVRKPRVSTVKELIEYAYSESGRKLQLTRKDLRDLARVPSDADAEMELVRRSVAGDPVMAVPPRILAALAELGAENSVKERILELAWAAMVSNPVFTSIAKLVEHPAAAPALSATRVSDAARGVTFASLDLRAEDFKESTRERLRVNAVTSFGLFRILCGGWTLEHFVAETGPVLWATPLLDRKHIAENAAALASTREASVLGLLAGHFNGLVRDAEEQMRIAKADASRELRRAQRAEEENRNLSALLKAELSRTQEISEQVAELKQDIGAEKNSRVVDKSHMVDDYEVLRTQVIRTLTSQTELLSDGLHAVRAGSTEVADEFLDRSLIAIQREVSRLKELGGGVK